MMSVKGWYHNMYNNSFPGSLVIFVTDRYLHLQLQIKIELERNEDGM